MPAVFSAVALRYHHVTMQTPQREFWDGHHAELGDAWILRKGDKVARCVLCSHEFGWELRL